MPSTKTIASALALALVGAVSASPIKDTTLPRRAVAETSNYMSITSKKTNMKNGKFLSAASRFHGKRGGSWTSSTSTSGSGDEELIDVDIEEEWTGEVTFGTEKVLLILDTGSSDTWVASSTFKCVSDTYAAESQASCDFGPLYNGTFTEGTVANENFNISYGDGEFAIGTLGYVPITIAGITVPKQQVAIVTEAYWEGDGVTTGLMGLAYSSLTSAYAGTNPALDNFDDTGSASGDQEPYSPVVTTMISDGLLAEPLFSLVLERSSSDADETAGGYIAFGGLPPISGTVGTYVETPILIHEFDGYPALEAKNRSFYTIQPTGYYLENTKKVASVVANTDDAIVDSGTTLLYVPTSIYDAYIESYSGAIEYQDYYYANCDSTAPPFGIEIAGTIFNITSADILLPDSGFTERGVTYCLIGLQDGGSGEEAMPIFGDVFLKNVVAVFDVGTSELKLAQHTY